MASRITTYTHDRLTFDVLDEGPLDGPVVVLLHGFPQRASSWSRVAPLLHAEGYRTLAPDQRGYSRLARPPRRRDYRLDLLVGDVVALVEAAGQESVHLVGHDWGAAVAWSTAATRPDLVRTLTAVSVPHPRAMVQALRTPGQLRKSWYMGLFQLPWVPEALLAGGFAERFLGSSGMDEETLARYRTEIVDTGALHYSLGWYRAMLLPGPGGLGRRVRVPTTHVWSDRDTALGRHGAELTESYVLADYELVVVEGATHWLPDEQPELLAEAILERAGAA